MKEPLVSVVMPCYNAAATVERALVSLSAQTYKNVEIVAIDDGSDDETADILAAHAQRDGRISVIRQEHAGIVAALNTGLGAARGELIARMDADDESHAERLARQAAFLAGHPETGVVGCGVKYAGGAEGRGYAEHVRWLNSLQTAEEISLNRFRESPLAHPGVMFWRALVAAHGGYRDGDFPEDYELWLRWLECGVRMASVKEELLVWYDSPRRLSRIDERYRVEAFYRLKAGYLARWLARHNRHHPRVIIGGAGRVTRRRAEVLAEHGVVIEAYADIDRRKIGRRYGMAPVIGMGEIPGAAECFVVPYVGARGAAGAWEQFLKERGFAAGQSYILAS